MDIEQHSRIGFRLLQPMHSIVFGNRTLFPLSCSPFPGLLEREVHDVVQQLLAQHRRHLRGGAERRARVDLQEPGAATKTGTKQKQERVAGAAWQLKKK